MDARRAVRFAAFAAVAAFVFVELANIVLGDFEPPPPPKPSRIKAGESLPPLPLPATPLRRTEKKREPAKPALIGKIQYGKEKWVTTEDGRRYSYLDWRSDTTDLYHLLNFTNAKLGLNYRYIETPLRAFSFNPAELPVLYFTGHDDFTFSDEELQKLGWYLRDGGTLIGDACCGANDFSIAFVRNVKKIFPDRPFREIDPDDPLYQCYNEIGQITYKEEGKGVHKGKPNLRGMYIGCRLAVILSTHDMSCGWARHEHPQGKRIAAEDTALIGSNMITYILAQYQYAKSYSVQKVYHEEGQPTREQFVFGQVIHGGDWDPNPTAVPNLLKFIAANSTLDVQFTRADVDLRKVDAFSHPFIYMTGHNDFELIDQEVVALRSYLRNGGVLLANACCGRHAFDTAFRRELKKVFNDQQPLSEIPLDHPLFASLYKIDKVQYSDWLRDKQPNLNTPVIEGVVSGGQLCVIYSRYDLGNGWEGIPHPYSQGYTPQDALRLGANAVIYSMTH
ncbi:MAG TPA: DUF4159 domain-containing protein [Planctomycetota bacterium]|nr:DUF4159 domain-containing protein [Planctomycetota bacterium]